MSLTIGLRRQQTPQKSLVVRRSLVLAASLVVVVVSMGALAPSRRYAVRRH